MNAETSAIASRHRDEHNKQATVTADLLHALNELVGLHADQVFVCGREDERKVYLALEKARRAIGKAIQQKP